MNRPGVRRLVSVAVVGLAVAAGLYGLRGTSTAAEAVGPTCSVGAADAVTAQSWARACGTRVELVSRRSERDQVFANPNGSFTLETSAVPRRVRRGDGTWAAVDTTLRASGGAVRPVATAVGLDFSSAGAGPMARVATAKGELALTAPWPLPAPALAGARATYANVLPGVDLVLVAKPEGFSETLVVRTRESVPALASIRFGVSAKDLTLRPDGGGFVAVDAAGATVFASPAPKMWDSSGGPGPADAARVPDAPVEGDRVADIGLTLGESHLTLAPDRGLLADPKAVLPLYLDPQITAPRPRWAYSNSGNYNYDDPAGVARVGLNPECCGGVWRGFFEFSIGGVAGARIRAASFNTVITHSWNCTNRPVTLYRTGGISAGNGGRTPWSPGLVEALVTREGNSCNAPSVSYPITGSVQAWADQGAAVVTLGLVNGSEGNSQYWRKFSVAQTFLVIDYNFPPSLPDGLASVGTSQRVGCGGPVKLNATGGVGLAATVRDVDAGATVLARYEWQNVTAGTPVTALPDTVSVAPPHTFQVNLPASSLPSGHTIQWRVRGFDGFNESATTPWCQFTVDNSTPGQPTIAANDLPVFPAAPPATAQVGSTVVATFQPAPGDTDIVGYYYGIGSVETVPTIWVPAWFNGYASAPVVPVASGLAKNFLTVVAVDAAGNRSPVPFSAPDAPGTRQFRANAAATPAPAPAPGDATGDGRADVTLLTDVGGARAALWRWNANQAGNGFVNPSAVQDVEVTYHIASTRTVQGDFDGDRLSDVAIFTQDGANVRLSVQRSNGNALFGAPAQVLTGWNVNNIKPVAGNFNADAAGRDDIAVVYNDGNATFSVRVLIANGEPGSPTFAAPATWYTNPAGWADWVNMKVFAGDFDGDGRVEVGHIYQYPSCVTRMWIHFSTGTALTAGAQVWDSGGAGTFCWAPTDLVAGDFDADGRGDVVALHDLGNCTATLIPFYGNANRTMTVAGRVWTSAAGTWCGGRTMLSTTNATGTFPTDVAAFYRCCGGFQLRGFTFASNGRSFDAPLLKFRGNVGPRGHLANANLVLGMSGTASSSAPSDWGWSLPAVTDGAKGGLGWSSWSNVETPHTEWVDLPLDEPGQISRVILYPRGDAGAVGFNFPQNFTIEVFDGTTWTVVVTRTNYPGPSTAAGHHFTFPARTATRVRITGTGLLLMQFAEIEAYNG